MIKPPPLDPQVRREIQRKAIHLSFIVLPLTLVRGFLPWPRTRGQWTLVLAIAVLVAIALDLARLHERRFRKFFGRFFGELIRHHEQSGLLGSTYLLLAALLAVGLFPRPIAAAAIGYTVLGDGLAAIFGRAYGGTRYFGKSLEGSLGGLLGCLAWAAYLVATGQLAAPIAITGALVASLVEFLPIPLDDNLGITLFSGYAMRLLWLPI